MVLHLRCMREEAGGNEADADMKNIQESSNCMEETDKVIQGVSASDVT